MRRNEEKKLSDYLKKFSSKNLKKFIFAAFNTELGMHSNELINPKIYTIWLPYNTNGFIYCRRRKGTWRGYIVINLYSFWKKSELSANMCYFYAYATVVHELEHIFILADAEKKDNFDYLQTIAIFENISKSGSALIERIISMVTMKENAKSMHKSYSTSPTELLCNKVSYERGIAALEQFLTQEEKENVQRIYASIKFLCEHLEMGYRSSSMPYNRFVDAVIKIQNKLKRSSNMYNLYPVLKSMFYSDGKLMSIKKIYENIEECDKDFCDNVLIQMFIMLKADFTSLFDEAPELKKYIEVLANRYCEKYSRYPECSAVGTIFCDEEIFEDNFIVILKNIKVLNELMQYYGMERTCGGIIPL